MGDHPALRTHGSTAAVYRSDVSISGEPVAVARSRAEIASRLIAAPAWLTTSAEVQDIDDLITATVDTSFPEARPHAIDEIDRRLASTTIAFDEWETLYRRHLQAAVEGGQRRHTVEGVPSAGAELAAPTLERQPRGTGRGHGGHEAGGRP